MFDEFQGLGADGDEIEAGGESGDVDLTRDGGEGAGLDRLAEGRGDGVMRNGEALNGVNAECGMRMEGFGVKSEGAVVDGIWG